MDVFPRSCCDPGEAVDLNQISLDSLVDFSSFLLESASQILCFVATFGGFHSLDLGSIPHQKLPDGMEDFVDHLRLPASTGVGVDLNDSHLWKTVLFIVINPLIWNIIARIEYKTKLLTRVCLDQKKIACFLLAIVIITLGIWRNHLVSVK